jgi:hypothetical protein
MRAFAGALFTVALSAQAPAPAVQGTLLDWDRRPIGELSVRVRDHHVVCFRFDGGTSIDRDGRRTDLANLRKGDMVEIVSEPGPNPRLPRARSVVVIAAGAEPSRTRALLAEHSRMLDDLFPRGDLTFAGVVTRLNPGRMDLRTRTLGHAEILLRDDTRYIGDGQETRYSGLKVNARVFVRAGRNLDDRIEAYQVMWGDILIPPVPERRGKTIPKAGGEWSDSESPEQQPRGPDGNQLLY